MPAGAGVHPARGDAGGARWAHRSRLGASRAGHRRDAGRRRNHATASSSLPRVAGMATMPSRADTAPRASASILAQVERLCLFLDRFDVTPAYAMDERIHVLRTAEGGDIRANCKLAGLPRETTTRTFFSVDDDVEYPADYCDTLESQLANYGGRAAV